MSALREHEKGGMAAHRCKPIPLEISFRYTDAFEYDQFESLP